MGLLNFQPLPAGSSNSYRLSPRSSLHWLPQQPGGPGTDRCLPHEGMHARAGGWAGRIPAFPSPQGGCPYVQEGHLNSQSPLRPCGWHRCSFLTWPGVTLFLADSGRSTEDAAGATVGAPSLWEFDTACSWLADVHKVPETPGKSSKTSSYKLQYTVFHFPLVRKGNIFLVPLYKYNIYISSHTFWLHIKQEE